MPRTIAICHRSKEKVTGEQRPTLVAIRENGETRRLKLDTERAELDFAFGKLPLTWRKAGDDEDLSSFPSHHIRERRIKAENRVERSVPVTYEGFGPGDTVVMILGGSGDRLAHMLSNRAEHFGNGTRVLRTPPYALKEARTGDGTDQDDLVLLELVGDEPDPELFYKVGPIDRAIIRVTEAYRVWVYAQRQRIACGQRIRKQLVGAIFCTEEGGYPEGEIEQEFERFIASDATYQHLLKVEKERARVLEQSVKATAVWHQVFEPIEGWGPAMTARLMYAVKDIRRFLMPPDYAGCETNADRKRAKRKARMRTKSKFMAFVGTHVLAGPKYADVPPDQVFPRRRSGGKGSRFSTDGRNAFYLFASEQCVKRPESVWGMKLRAFKVADRERHPEPVTVNGGKQRYYDGHIHRRAIWRTATRFSRTLVYPWLAAVSQNGSSHTAQD